MGQELIRRSLNRDLPFNLRLPQTQTAPTAIGNMSREEYIYHKFYLDFFRSISVN